MIAEKTLGTTKDYNDKKIDYVDLDWFNSKKKINKLVTHSGLEIGTRLDDHAMSHGLKQDDVLFVLDDSVVAVNILPCDCLLVEVTDHQLVKFCYEVGNKHSPFFYGDKPLQFILPLDKPMQAMLEKLGINCSVVNTKIDLSKNISNSLGGHSH